MSFKVLELVVNWLKYGWDQRQELTLQLFQKVRLGLVLQDDHMRLIGPEMLAIPGCTELLNEVQKLRESVKSKYTLAAEEPDFFATRSTVTVSIILMLIM